MPGRELPWTLLSSEALHAQHSPGQFLKAQKRQSKGFGSVDACPYTPACCGPQLQGRRGGGGHNTTRNAQLSMHAHMQPHINNSLHTQDLS